MLHHGSRRFLALEVDRIIGVADLDPIWTEGKLIGYVPTVRASADFSQGLYYVFAMEIIRQLKREQVQWFYLGASPLSQRVSAPMEGGRAFARLLGLVHRYGNALYNFRGIEFVKSVFGGEEWPIYACTPSRFPLLSAVRLLRVCHVL